MPKKLDPRVQVDYVLKSDRDLTENIPTFKLKILTPYESKDRDKILKEITKLDDTDIDQATQLSAKALFYSLESWENMGDYEFSAEGVAKLLTLGEINELNMAVAELNGMTIEEKKA